MSSDELQRMVQTADDAVDYVKLMFLVDLGEGHIDHYESSDGPPAPALEALDCSPVFAAVLIEDAHPVRTAFSVNLEAAIPRDPPKYLSPCCADFSLRGPPQSSLTA